MGLWIAMAVLAAAAAAACLAPLYRTRAAAGTDRAAGEIYRDQLSELTREAERGLIGDDEAEAARVEIARRLLGTATDGEAEAGNAGPWRRLAAAVAIVAPLAAVGMYLAIGSPSLPDRPLSTRMTAPPAEADLAALIARVEAHLGEAPGDGRGWEVIAPVYARIGRFDDAAAAFARAIAILGPTAAREANLGEAIMWASGGLIRQEARAAFMRAAALDSRHARSRFYLARALEQDGRDDEAVAAWQALLADARPDRPWVIAAAAALEEASARLDDPAAGPAANDVAAAAELSPRQRRTMIEGMVASLAARLEDEPDDAEGWARLIRSYIVLDQPNSAARALRSARTGLEADAGGLAVVEAMAQEFGLDAAPEQVR